MAALETIDRAWEATFLCDRNCGLSRSECLGVRILTVEIVRTKRDHEPIPYYWVTVNSVGVWPGTDSNEWIEYIGPDMIVERDGDLWWRKYDPSIDAFRYTQMTKGDACNSSSIQTDSR